MVSLKNIYTQFIFIGIFLIPFNSYQGIGFLGEFSIDSCVIFFLIASFLLTLETFLTGKIKLPIKNPVLLLLFLIFFWFLIATLLNSTSIVSHYFKQTSGINRFIRQYAALLISGFLLLITYYNVFIKIEVSTLFFRIRKVIFYSFIVVSIYTIIEILIVKFNLLGLMPLIELFNYFPFTDVYVDLRNYRISSVTFEPPALATYLFTIAGWMFSYILTEKGLKKYIPGLLTVAFALFSGSRAALLIIFLQFFVFLLMLVNKKYIKYLGQILKYSFIILTIVFLFKGRTISNYIFEKATSFEIQDDTHAISNKSRFGIQYTLFLVFLESPIYGSGFGQQAFISKDLYPKWATDDNWEFRLNYLNEDVKSFPPGYNIYLRILAESGIIGFFLFSLFLVSIVYVSYKTIKLQNEKSLIGLVIIISMIGFIFNWFKMDTFRVYGFWINLALLLVITRDNIRFNIKKDNEQI